MFWLKSFCLKLFQNNFRGLLHLMIIFQRVQCSWNNFEIISDVVACALKLFQNTSISDVTTALEVVVVDVVVFVCSI